MKIPPLSVVWDGPWTFNAHVYICQISYLLRNAETWNLNHKSSTGSYNSQKLVWLPQRTFTIFRWQCGAIFYCSHHFVRISLTEYAELFRDLIYSILTWHSFACVLCLRESPRFIASQPKPQIHDLVLALNINLSKMRFLVVYFLEHTVDLKSWCGLDLALASKQTFTYPICQVLKWRICTFGRMFG